MKTSARPICRPTACITYESRNN